MNALVIATFTMRFFGAFLEPGLGSAPARPGDELVPAAIAWKSPTEGGVSFTQWKLNGWADFKTTANRRTLLSLHTNLDVEPSGRIMDVWRLRHGYRLDPSRGYVWASLEDLPPAMDKATGEAYDRYLRAVWRLWAERKVRETLANGTTRFEQAADPGQLEQNVALEYNKAGLVGTPTLKFHYRYWHAPVTVSFVIAPKKPTDHDPSIIGIKGAVTSAADATELRRRHGYRKGLGGYALDKDFPDPSFPIRELGPKLDELLGAGQSYWAEAAANVIVAGLDNQLQDAVSRHPGPSAKPALTSLQRLASDSRW